METKMDTQKTAAANATLGFWYGVLAYITWGVLPLYWKLLQAVPALEILAHRIFWSFIFMALYLLCSAGRRSLAGIFSHRKKLLFIFLCGIIISLNWYTFIYAVNSDQVIEASMGYYINPLVVVFLGVVVLKEKLNRWQGLSIIMAATGVMIITLQYGKVPWIALFLAVSFALYGLTKKLVGADPITGLALETLIVMPVALFYIVSREASGVGALAAGPWLTGLILAGAGVVTAMPLLWYARGVQLSQFSMMGFLQFIAPTISLLLGIFVFKEYFSFTHVISFCFIWAALLIFTLANLGVLKHKPATGATAKAVDAPVVPHK